MTAVAVLRERLDETADALARADLVRLLSSEMQLQSALAALANCCSVAGDKATLAAELERVRASLVRCRRLGVTLTEFVHVSLSEMRDEPVTHTFRHSA
jgi:hypothetical protein